jgi:hypothetical protein
VPRHRCRVRLFEALAGFAGLAEASSFEPFELLGHRFLDQLREVTVGHGGTHEGLQPGEFLV